ncbi:HAMP domain-containing histidine kinase [Rhizobium sp. BT-226]|uniref:HAMP domain-containing histidine kinase n=1 Tax=Rhizobium sp. BT-226 TaxID=2986922 RepID=UPI0021F75553|nr:HAMP domain-containing histidine kinase [Rhizobium sp. BT-226]MCW0021348.1 HAMP domain-containing histidine kinase [Rhizobium sp. BT-226]
MLQQLRQALSVWSKDLNSFFLSSASPRLSRPVWISCLALVVVGGLVGAQWWLSLRESGLREYRNSFEQLKSLETRWNNELLSLQLGFAPNYDAVTAIARDLELRWRSLNDIASDSATLNVLSPKVEAYGAALEQKIWLSEQIKASYAMLRNSVSVLPDAARALYRDPEVLLPVQGTGTRVSDLVAEVITGTIAFTASPTQSLGDAVRRQVAATRSAAGQLSPQTADVLDRLLAQVDVVVKERKRSNELMLALTAVPTGAASDSLEDELQLIEQSSLERRHRIRDVTVLAGVLLFIAAIFSALTLRQRFVRLRKDNWLLNQINENAEQQLIQSAKLSALGQMVAGISHEINTPLAYVKAVFELIKDRLTARPQLAYPVAAGTVDAQAEQEWRNELETLLDDGLHGLEEMASFVRSMKSFSRLDKGNVESFSVVAALENALQIAGPHLGPEIEVRREFDPVPAINGSPSQLRQVFLNLIVNAVDAMADKKEGGVLTLRTRHTGSDMIQIEVGDTGKGIEEEHLNKVFDPFFTTKEVGEGTGMGLSISYRIIENHGGTITVLSKAGRGTVFTITLPRQDDKDFPASAP